jgi:hypothetical protein
MTYEISQAPTKMPTIKRPSVPKLSLTSPIAPQKPPASQAKLITNQVERFQTADYERYTTDIVVVVRVW